MAEHTTSILDKYPTYEATIGIEVHVQLSTNTKIFCSCANTVAKDPNSHICQICTGYPGAMPMLNKKVVDCAILAGLATNCTINQKSTFDRKHYFYPDLPKNFQITQQAEPICTDGYVPIRLEDGSTKNINLIRIHIEEDAGKNIHSSYSNESFVDLNRAGTPLLEIVSHPDISSTYEVRTYLKTLRSIVQYLGICTGNMDEGSFRADTNISVRKKGQKELGTKCELKNINSFKFITDATEHELERQIKILESGERVRSETRLWDSKNRTTIMMRSKEETADYRFFQEPDLPIILIDDARLEKAKSSMPELPLAKFERFTKQLGLTEYEADILIEDIDLANYFDAAKKHTQSPSLIHWILRDLMGYLKEQKISLAECKITPARLGNIVDLVDQGVINSPTAKEVLILVAQTDQDPITIIEEKGLKQIGSVDELEALVKEIIAANPKQTEEYRSGKDKLFGFFVGQMMQKTKGKGNPQLINDLIKKHLNS
ncbi:MAG TPA: Asp-tRNA(Asn)/Glu-tRNA(Gln) amidotransferase subunit GatB [Candidatus Babeliales bacterium]|jgi:aspartyl-tRNA(Asn)/glutamyl-tRNA(Gln) amidotransferase subunit B|nr:Asp-tRNA(Asn)/Glu-tRNA(Gln) amidotransferase subunit GatB [Candidatus Babeliales bacterium]